MIPIGEFSKLSRISVRMLRYFDKFELLKPNHIDDRGFRFYDRSQLRYANRIVYLQANGFQLQEIKSLMKKNLNDIEKEKIVSACKERVESEFRKTKEQMKLINNFNMNLFLTQDNFKVETKKIPAHQVASLRMKILSYSEEGMLWNLLYQELGMQQPVFAVPNRNVSVYHDNEYMEENPDIEIQVSVVGNYHDTEHIKIQTIEEEDILCITFYGEYEQMGMVNEAAMDWMDKNKVEWTGQFYNVFIKGKGESSNPSDWITECCYRIKTNET